MRISNNIEMLKLDAVLVNGPGSIYPVIMWDEKDVVLFDAGLPGMTALICEAAHASDVPIERLNHIAITHSDMDHIGSLFQILHEFEGKLTVLAHKEEKPYIECECLPVRLVQLEKRIDEEAGVQREHLITLTENLKNNYKLFKANVNVTIEDGEALPLCDGIIGIYTPGHTPGHMCYYIKKWKLLIAGDLLQVDNGILVKCPDFTTIDKNKVIESLNKLRQYDIDMVICYHGGLYQGNISKRIAEILNETMA